MKKNWTPAQQNAIHIQNKTMLVSAAAGSGKTATLTERIIVRLTDSTAPADISKMLIVTFTRAAAEELKNRIFSALGEELAKDPGNRHLSTQLIQLGSAHICTIDSFYLELVRTNFSSLGISSSLRIGDQAELEVLSKEIMEKTIDTFYDQNESFSSLAECLIGTKSTHQLSDILLHLYHRLSSVPEGILFLKNNAQQVWQETNSNIDFFQTGIGAVLHNQVQEEIQHYQMIFSSACDYLADDPAFAKMYLAMSYDRNFCDSVLKILDSPTGTYQQLCKLFQTYSPLRMTMPKEEFLTKECIQYQELRKEQIEKIRKLKNRSFSKSEEDLHHAMYDTAKYTELLFHVLQLFEQNMTEEKNKRNILDFYDIRRLTLRLLVKEDGTPTDIAQQYAEQFTDIYIDEYQDVDLVQDMIFRSISKSNNRFMVGDIKQSIYSFRGAEPQVFSHYRAAFPALETSEAQSSSAVSVFMSENFRCDQNIIEFTNLVCSRIFAVCAESINYRPEDDLKFAKLLPYESYSAKQVEVTVLLTSSDTKSSNLEDGYTEESENEVEEDGELPEKKEWEANYIADQIQQLLSNGTKADGTPILPGDIAVLFRSRSMSSYLAKALSERGILSSESDSTDYFENPDVLMVLSLLNTIDNPQRDIYLAGTLRSPIFSFTMEDLIQIRRSCDSSYSLYDALTAYQTKDDALAKHCRQFHTVLSDWRNKAIALPVDRFLRILFESEFFVASGLVCEPNESGKGGNLLRLYEYARTFEIGSFKGLYNFIEFINTIIEENKKIEVPTQGASPNRVNLMTIHQSKGLEFPVCFLCGTGTKFNRKDQYASLLFEYPLGAAMKIADNTGFARINTPMREALSERTGIRQIEEEMRILYVAMTRAREQLYITAVSSSAADKLMEQASLRVAFCGRHTLLHCNSYLDWILLPFADSSQKTDCCRLSFIESIQQTKQTDTPLPQNPSDELPVLPEPDQNLVDLLTEKFSFQYPYNNLRRIPAKLSVSKLSPDILDENDLSASLSQHEKKVTIPEFFLTGNVTEATAAERGTATHLFFQFCNFEYAKEYGIANEIARLVEKQFIPERVSKLIYQDEVALFFQSDLIREIFAAKQVIREQRFNVLLSPQNFTTDISFRAQLANEKMAVQGVVDLILINKNGDLCLYDYKTDRFTPNERQNTTLATQKMNRIHGLQLSYYAHAIAQMFERPCKKIGIYATHTGKIYPITPIPLTLPEETLDRL